jgi:hypothetical protein
MKVRPPALATPRALWAIATTVILAIPSGYSPAGSITYSFNNITNNNATNAQTGESQLTVEVSSVVGTGSHGGDLVDFTFRNVGPNAASICDVYFDDGTLLGIAKIMQSSGVEFGLGASPKDLPGGNDIDPKFHTTKDFSADSEPAVQTNGVNPGEWVTIRFELINNQDYQGIIGALNRGLLLQPGDNPDNPDPNFDTLRIGIHVQGFANGGSESFINGQPLLTAPEPSTLALALTGIAGLAYVGRQRLRRAQAV